MLGSMDQNPATGPCWCNYPTTHACCHYQNCTYRRISYTQYMRALYTHAMHAPPHSRTRRLDDTHICDELEGAAVDLRVAQRKGENVNKERRHCIQITLP
jgi:hypothetical protein